MPVTKTAKRALRASRRKAVINAKAISALEVAVRVAKRNHLRESLLKAISLADRAAKEKMIHKNKASRIKETLSKFLKS